MKLEGIKVGNVSIDRISVQDAEEFAKVVSYLNNYETIRQLSCTTSYEQIPIIKFNNNGITRIGDICEYDNKLFIINEMSEFYYFGYRIVLNIDDTVDEDEYILVTGYPFVAIDQKIVSIPIRDSEKIGECNFDQFQDINIGIEYTKEMTYKSMQIKTSRCKCISDTAEIRRLKTLKEQIKL